MVGKFAVFVVGPAGVGKTTFCQTMFDYMQCTKGANGAALQLLNLDPGSNLNNRVSGHVDIRDYTPLEAVMDMKILGPNGALIKCMEYCVEWLPEVLEGFTDEYVFVDCPGQLELYTHSSAMLDIIDVFRNNGYSMCSLFLLDANFASSDSKLIAGSLQSLLAMLQLEIPHLTVLSKMDLFPDLEVPNLDAVLEALPDNKLNNAIGNILGSFNLVDFVPFDPTSEDSMYTMVNLMNQLLLNEDVDLSGGDM